MKLIDADELLKRIDCEMEVLDLIFDKPEDSNYLWQRKNEIVRIKSIIAHMPEINFIPTEKGT